MSLLPSMTAPNANNKYFVENIGGNGQLGNDVPCIKAGVVFGAVRVADGDAGMVLVGGGIGNTPLISGVRGGGAAGTTLNLGASTASQNNIVLTDALTTINTSVNLAAVGADLTVADDINVGGNVVLTNGATGKAISGYYSVNTAVAGTGAQANPAGLTAGSYLVVYVPTGGAQGQQPSGVFYWSGVNWNGNAIGANFTAGVPDIALLPTAGNATLTVGGGAASVPGTLYWRKLLN